MILGFCVLCLPLVLWLVRIHFLFPSLMTSVRHLLSSLPFSLCLALSSYFASGLDKPMLIVCLYSLTTTLQSPHLIVATDVRHEESCMLLHNLQE